MRRITHRELRNSSSDILRAVENGEAFEISNYGRVVAVLIPPPPDPLTLARLAGQSRQPRGTWQEALAGDPVEVAGDSLSILAELRDDR